MNFLELIIVERIVRKAVRQGPQHAKNINVLYWIIRDACEQEFTEDSPRTLDAFLKDLFDLTQAHPR